MFFFLFLFLIVLIILFSFWLFFRWIEAWSSQITTGLALFLVLCGVLTTISLFTPICIVAGLLQL